ncbi:unnamed protein product [Adineta ricciae]|uniref:EGF-like domain-containing protein n=2 Tax=Adineta ricciae TaxID=249248 RepID=A0A814FWJ4_ADIRI|nr:unnamed protein product [Adineta ricciae]
MVSRKNYIRFPLICNGFDELSPTMIDGRNQTDETECNNWPCNNIYTRCNSFWNCLNGEDEIGCDESQLLNCSSNEHICFSSSTKNLICLNINKTNDGRIDCLGALDEPTICQRSSQYVKSNFHCTQNNSSTCIAAQNFCYPVNTIDSGMMNCEEFHFLSLNRTSEDRLQSKKYYQSMLCKMYVKRFEPTLVFSLGKTKESTTNLLISTKQSVNKLSFDELAHLCHRGLPLRVWSNKNESKVVCLCPHTYYGSKCQYQNQRISFSIKIQLLSHMREIPFQIIIFLIENNNQRIIHSYVQFMYMRIRDCEAKFSTHLLYSTRSKNLTQNYFIHIDIYDKTSSIYHGSFLYPIINSFLPVHPLNLSIDIPSLNNEIKYCSKKHHCIHGKCIKYLNIEQDENFCQCDPGWSGQYCTISHLIHCKCSPDSICLGIDAHNRPICLCPLHKIGSR